MAAQFFKGTADWESIAAVKKSVSRMPVVGNGDEPPPDPTLDEFLEVVRTTFPKEAPSASAG